MREKEELIKIIMEWIGSPTSVARLNGILSDEEFQYIIRQSLLRTKNFYFTGKYCSLLQQNENSEKYTFGQFLSISKWLIACNKKEKMNFVSITTAISKLASVTGDISVEQFKSAPELFPYYKEIKRWHKNLASDTCQIAYEFSKPDIEEILKNAKKHSKCSELTKISMDMYEKYYDAFSPRKIIETKCTLNYLKENDDIRERFFDTDSYNVHCAMEFYKGDISDMLTKEQIIKYALGSFYTRVDGNICCYYGCYNFDIIKDRDLLKYLDISDEDRKAIYDNITSILEFEYRNREKIYRKTRIKRNKSSDAPFYRPATDEEKINCIKFLGSDTITNEINNIRKAEI